MSLLRGLCILLVVFIYHIDVLASPCGGGKDTARAMVVYNLEHLEMDKEGFSPDFMCLVDSALSLDHIDPHLNRLIDVVASVRQKTEEELVTLIDSLFTLEEIPYALINEINFQIAKEEFAKNDVEDDLFRIPDDGSPYPANILYQSWSTTSTNPYGRDLSARDSTMTLLLAGILGTDDYFHPVDNVVTSKFGWRDGRNHNGYDLDLEVWDPVHSAFAGKVRYAGWAGGFGRLVIVRHHNGLETFYAHLHRFKVQAGDDVNAGDVLALGGSSGHSTGSHLHFEMRFKGIPVDPGQIIDFKKQALHSDTIVLKKTRWSYSVYPKGLQYHVVKKGDYLHRIANAYGTSIDVLCDLNGIRRNDHLRPGQRIRIGTQ